MAVRFLVLALYVGTTRVEIAEIPFGKSKGKVERNIAFSSPTRINCRKSVSVKSGGNAGRFTSL